MTAVPDGQLADIATRHGLKEDEVVWADRNVFGLLVGLKNGVSRFVERTSPPPRRMNP